jgi:hypothetical protein
MKVTVLKPVEVNIVYVDVVVSVDETDIQWDSISADCHGLCDGQLRLRFNLDTKTVENWTVGKAERICLKVCDEGIYRLLDSNRNIVHERCCYVPSFVPNDGTDYFACNIAADGTVTMYNGEKWQPNGKQISQWIGEE